MGSSWTISPSKKANEKLIMQDKKYKEFISVATHELRMPIQPIIGLSYLLKYEKGSLVGKRRRIIGYNSKKCGDSQQARRKYS